MPKVSGQIGMNSGTKGVESYLKIQASKKVIAGRRLHIAAVKVGDEYFNPA